MDYVEHLMFFLINIQIRVYNTYIIIILRE